MVKLWREEQAGHSAPLLQMPESVTNAMHKAAFNIWAAASTLARESVERTQHEAGEAITKAKAELSEYAGEVSRLERELEQANIAGSRFYSNGWRITDNPTIERSMININPSFFHNLFEVAIRNAIPDIKENRIKNNILGKMSTFKTDHDLIL